MYLLKQKLALSTQDEENPQVIHDAIESPQTHVHNDSDRDTDAEKRHSSSPTIEITDMNTTRNRTRSQVITSTNSIRICCCCHASFYLMFVVYVILTLSGTIVMLVVSVLDAQKYAILSTAHNCANQCVLCQSGCVSISYSSN